MPVESTKFAEHHRSAARNRPERSAAGGGGSLRAGLEPLRLVAENAVDASPQGARSDRLGLTNPFRATMLATEGQHMTTSAERMRALRAGPPQG
jgi:hypothetical protein